MKRNIYTLIENANMKSSKKAEKKIKKNKKNCKKNEIKC